MLVNDLGDGCFVTLILACLDPCNRTLVYASAGHVPGYILDSSGALEHTLESSGVPLGLFPHVRYARSRNLPIHTGNLLALLTDGVTESEAPDGNPWGAKGVLSYLSACQNQSASELVEGLYQEARRIACNEVQKDDITSVIVKAEPVA
jgi:sigma-B regulation protein RsbU (phosphoserine phosphatase)